MTQDEINQLVEQAGFHGVLSIGVVMDSKQLETFTKLVELRYQKKIADLENIICQRHWDVLQEREACAKIIYDSYETTTEGEGIPEDWLLTLAELIEARGQA
jgi:hypothetical protein